MSEFDKYIVQGEPDKKAKANAWQMAIGLQDVDGLKPSEYLIKTAVQHIVVRIEHRVAIQYPLLLCDIYITQLAGVFVDSLEQTAVNSQ